MFGLMICKRSKIKQLHDELLSHQLTIEYLQKLLRGEMEETDKKIMKIMELENEIMNWRYHQ